MTPAVCGKAERAPYKVALRRTAGTEINAQGGGEAMKSQFSDAGDLEEKKRPSHKRQRRRGERPKGVRDRLATIRNADPREEGQESG